MVGRILACVKIWEKVRPELMSFMKDAAHPIAQIQKSFQNGPGVLVHLLHSPSFLSSSETQTSLDSPAIYTAFRMDLLNEVLGGKPWLERDLSPQVTQPSCTGSPLVSPPPSG